MDSAEIDKIVRAALAEDLPDITSESIFDADERGNARFLVKATGVLAGMPFAEATFKAIDPTSSFAMLKHDGDTVAPGDVVAEVEASVIALLSGERTALNFLQRASGIATTTRMYVDAVAGTRAKIYDTRKTAPGLRALDKYAVVQGGGENHRIGLFDMFLIKNNHVERTAGAVPLEASGGVTMESVRAIAESGVDRISVGALTHSVKALDISMRVASRLPR